MEHLSVRPKRRWAFLAPLSLLPILPVLVFGLPGSSKASTSVVPPPPIVVQPLTPEPLVTALEVRETVSVTLYNVNHRETATFVLPLDGKLEPEQAKLVGRFFRDKRTGRHGPMSEVSLSILADLARTFPGRTIEVVSGWRAPPNGAPHSKHFKGRAIDLRIPGVKTAVVRDHLWLKHRHVGVGFYPHQNFVHVDSRPDDKDTAWISRREGAPNRYSPAWAERLLPDGLKKANQPRRRSARASAASASVANQPLWIALPPSAQPPAAATGMQRLAPN